MRTLVTTACTARAQRTEKRRAAKRAREEASANAVVTGRILDGMLAKWFELVRPEPCTAVRMRRCMLDLGRRCQAHRCTRTAKQKKN